MNLWIQCHFPSLSIKWVQRDGRAFALLSEGELQTTLMIEQQGEQIGVVVRGTRALWLELVRVYEAWLMQGKPGRESAMLTVVGRRQWIRVELNGTTHGVSIAGEKTGALLVDINVVGQRPCC